MEWWKLGLDYLKVATGWPIILLLIVIVLRRPIAALFKRDFEAEAVGVKVRVGPETQAASEALEDARNPPTTEITAPETQETSGSDEVDTSIAINNASQFESRIKELEAREEALVRVLSEGARIGWEWAKAEKSSPPRLIVNWSSEGAPKVTIAEEFSSSDYLSRRSAERYERLVLENLARIAPGEVEPVIGGPDTGIDATLRDGKAVIGVMVKYSQHENAQTSAIIRRLINRYIGSLVPILIVSNFRLTNAATNYLLELHESGQVKVHWVRWRDERDNIALQRGVQIALSDAQN
ncbi:hypothetical protein GCM10009733_096430 [Nonomuraea maheshkhaliensis]|uniref:Restriction endonuclease type IV Mrr domain-containing protein n=1 Tax=Nonomuraea maheshkhaliensis TaxID=419590 RepID=A0ABN2HBA5_9ACTN